MSDEKYAGKAIPEVEMFTDAQVDYAKAICAQANEQGGSLAVSWWWLAGLLNRLDAEQAFNTGIKARLN